MKQAKDVLPPAFEGEKPNSSFGGSFYSYIRDEALSLNVLLDVDPNNPQIGIMAKQLSEQLKNQYYLNTQENAFSLLALGKNCPHGITIQHATATVSANGKTIGHTTGDNVVLDTKQYINTALQLNVKGQRQLLLFLGNKWYFN